MQLSGDFWPVGLVVCALLAVSPAVAQDVPADEEYRPTDTVFSEIQLSADGVVAIDTAGYEWYYDFESGVFVHGIQTVSPEDDLREGLVGDDLPADVRCTEEKKVKPFEQSSVWVGYEEYVDGDILAMGRVTVKGWVRGNIQSIRKRVLVTESGRVDGDIKAPTVIVRPGAEHYGRVIETSPVPELEKLGESFTADGLIVVAVFTVGLLFFGFLVVSLMPRQFATFQHCFQQYRAKTFLLGFFFVFFMPAIVLLVTITIVGIFVVPFLPLLYLFAIGLGIVAFGNIIGRLFARRFLGGEKHPLAQSTVGIVLMMSFWFITAVLLGAGDDVSYGFGIFFLVISIILSAYPVMAGVGAAILTRFGIREYTVLQSRPDQMGVSGAPTPAPPPIPNGPPPAHSPGPIPPRATPPSSPRIPEQEE